MNSISGTYNSTIWLNVRPLRRIVNQLVELHLRQDAWFPERFGCAAGDPLLFSVGFLTVANRSVPEAINQAVAPRSLSFNAAER
ncbi:hypothetical protein BLJAPNOD_02165 [Ensifer sp. M14]|nr:hypothetical protein BLJAPNOD_02165 [Ensifer sp. M14]